MMADCRRYQLNSRFFAKLTTEEQAYWLGFLSADGSVGVRTVTLKLAEKDYAHVEKFRAALGSQHPIRRFEHSGGRRAAVIQVGCVQMVADLEHWGVIRRKSLVIRPPALPLELRKHYWRGVVDGDGCIAVERQGLTVVGSLGMVTGFLEFARSVTTYCDQVSVRPDHNIYRVYLARPSAVPVLTEMYADAVIALDRKRLQFHAVANAAAERAAAGADPYKGFTKGADVARMRVLQAASAASRNARTHCRRGHEYLPDCRRDKKGARVCGVCMSEHQKVWRQRHPDYRKRAAGDLA